MTHKLFLLGRPLLETPGGTLRLERKTAAVLAYLALEGATSKYRLAGWLWPESGETTARNNMRQLLRRLRMAAGEIVLGEDLIELAPEVEADVGRWSYLESPSLNQLRQEEAFLEGGDYDDLPELAEWVESTRAELRELRARAAEAEATRLERAENFKTALEYAQIRLRVEPLSEEGYRQVARLQYLLGDRGAALATLERCRTVLAQELGAAPLPETLRLLRMIETGAHLPDAPQKPKSALIPAATLRPPVLAGREREWAIMEEAWEAGKLIFLVGDPGVGKSRLASDFLSSKCRYIHLETRPGDAKIPYSFNNRMVRTALRQYPDYQPPEWVRRTLAPWLPELGEVSLGLDPALQIRYFDAIGHVFNQIGLHGEAAFVDDLQFMDDSSARTGEYLLSSLFPLNQPGGLKGFVCCYRKGELSPAVEQIHAEMAAQGIAVRIFLEPLSRDSIQTLLGGMGIEHPEHLVQGLARYTGGNPLFILETLKYLIETDTLEGGLPARLAPQGKVATLIARRLGRLSPTALNLARAAAVAGTEFDLRLAAYVLERPAMELAESHAELESAQVLKGNAFTHDLVFETVLAGVPTAVKQVLHSRTAKYLEEGGASPALVAQHWLEAGDELKAAEQLLRAAQQATVGSRLAESLGFAQRAIELYQKHKDPREYEATWRLAETLGAHGSFEQFGQAITRLVGLARNPQEKVKALAGLAEWLHMTRRYEEALEKVNEALAMIGPGEGHQDLLNQASLRQTELLCCLRLGRFAQAQTALAVYKHLAERLGNLEVKGSVLEDEGLLWAALDRHREAIRYFDETLAMIEQEEQFHYAKSRLLSRRAHSWLALGQTEAVLGDVAEAKRAVAEYGVSSRAYVQPCIAEAFAHLVRGQLAEAWEAVQEAERWDQEEEPKVTYLALARVLQALGQTERAVAELEAYFAQRDGDRVTRAQALLLLGQITGDGALEEAQTLVAQIPKPELQAQLYLAQAALTPPQQAVFGLEQALQVVRPLGLELLEAEALARKAEALLGSNRTEEAFAAVQEALAHPASWLSPAQVHFTAFRVLEAIGDPGAQAHLERAQNWVQATAQKLPRDLRAAFFGQALHRQIL